MMNCCVSTAMLLLASTALPSAYGGKIGAQLRQNERRTTIERIVGYMPTNDVSDQAAIDLDQQAMEKLVLERKLDKAKLIYEKGGHSKSFASLTLVHPKSDGNFPAGSSVWGINNAKLPITGKTKDSVKWVKGVANVTIDVLYDIDSTYQPHCMVGELTVASMASLDNCFIAENIIRIGLAGSEESSAKQFNYTYSQHLDNKNNRTLQSLATETSTIFRGMEDFEIFTDFYGQPDYADRWVSAALYGGQTGFKSGLGNADFALLESRFGHGEGLIKGSSFLIVYMYVIGKLDLAVAHCGKGDKQLASLSLDEAVAYYAGSLSSGAADGSTGVFMYALADNRAINFRTAGHTGNLNTGTAYVNVQILEHFKRMQLDVNSGNVTQCLDAKEHSKAIVDLMKVPIIQSILAYAYIRDRDESQEEEEIEKSEAKGASYTAAILPYVHKCNPKEALTLYDNMRIGSSEKDVNYVAVRRALEQTYDCLGVTCSLVGGIWDKDENKYVADGSPCGIPTSSSNSTVGRSFGRFFGVTVTMCLCAFFFMRYRRRRGSRKGEMTMGTIAAVSEIS